jgi:uncharacterized protein YydD (DUF2326 family)
MVDGENLSEKNKKLRFDLIDKVKVLRGELKAIDDERRTLSNQFVETLEALKKKVILEPFSKIFSYYCSRMLMSMLPRIN